MIFSGQKKGRTCLDELMFVILCLSIQLFLGSMQVLAHVSMNSCVLSYYLSLLLIISGYDIFRGRLILTSLCNFF